MYQKIPDELKALPQWVAWKFEQVKTETGTRLAKVPYSPKTYLKASTVNPQTWGKYEEAIEIEGFWGIGFVFSKDDPYAGIDLDKCRDSKTGNIEEWARQIIGYFNSYTEISPSGTGVHIFIKGRVPAGGNRKGASKFTVREDILPLQETIFQKPL